MKQETLYKFFEGTATYEEEATIKQWMESHPDNQHILLKERKLFDAMLLSGHEAPLPTKTKETVTRPRILLTEILKIASVVLLTLGSYTLFQTLRADQQPIAMQTLTVPAGQRINLTLPDGTHVWLNARTTLRYPALFGKENRKVQLDGEAYFDVAKNKDKPFLVETTKCQIEVLGTQFNVEAYSDAEKFETTLMRGSVKLTSNDDPAQTLILRPDNKASLQAGKLVSQPVDDYSTYRWKEGLICFKNETFSSIMEKFEKYYGMNIQVDNPDVQKHLYTGKFRQTDGIEYALRVLQKEIRFQYVRDEESQTLHIR